MHNVSRLDAGTKLWSNVMEILDEKDGVDTELLVYAMTLINKVSKCYLIKTFHIVVLSSHSKVFTVRLSSFLFSIFC